MDPPNFDFDRSSTVTIIIMLSMAYDDGYIQSLDRTGVVHGG